MPRHKCFANLWPANTFTPFLHLLRLQMLKPHLGCSVACTEKQRAKSEESALCYFPPLIFLQSGDLLALISIVVSSERSKYIHLRDIFRNWIRLSIKRNIIYVKFSLLPNFSSNEQKPGYSKQGVTGGKQLLFSPIFLSPESCVRHQPDWTTSSTYDNCDKTKFKLFCSVLDTDKWRMAVLVRST